MVTYWCNDILCGWILKLQIFLSHILPLIASLVAEKKHPLLSFSFCHPLLQSLLRDVYADGGRSLHRCFWCRDRAVIKKAGKCMKEREERGGWMRQKLWIILHRKKHYIAPWCIQQERYLVLSKRKRSICVLDWYVYWNSKGRSSTAPCFLSFSLLFVSSC